MKPRTLVSTLGLALAMASWAAPALAQRAALVKDVDRPAPSQHVTVMTFSATACNGGFAGARAIDTRILPDGTTSSFTIPAGQVLVVTSIQASVQTRSSVNATVRVGPACGPGCMMPFADLMVLTDSVGRGGTHLELPTGFVVKPGVQLCVADVNFGGPNAFATVRGYLAKDE